MDFSGLRELIEVEIKREFKFVYFKIAFEELKPLALNRVVEKIPEKKTHEFHIAGVPYKLKTSHNDELVKELVEFLNQRMSQALAVTKNGSYQNAAVLTALHLAEELLLLKRKAYHELESLEEKILKLSHDLENTQKK